MLLDEHDANYDFIKKWSFKYGDLDQIQSKFENIEYASTNLQARITQLENDVRDLKGKRK